MEHTGEQGLLDLLQIDIKVYLGIYDKHFNYRDYFSVREFALLRCKLKYLAKFGLAVKPRGFFYENMVKSKFAYCKKELDDYIESKRDMSMDTYSISEYNLIRTSLNLSDNVLELEKEKRFGFKKPVFRDIRAVEMDSKKLLEDVKECQLSSYTDKEGKPYPRDSERFNRWVTRSSDEVNLASEEKSFVSIQEELDNAKNLKPMDLASLENRIPCCHAAGGQLSDGVVYYCKPKCGAQFKTKKVLRAAMVDGVFTTTTTEEESGRSVCKLVEREGGLKALDKTFKETEESKKEAKRNKKAFESKMEQYKVKELETRRINSAIRKRNNERKVKFMLENKVLRKSYSEKCDVWESIIQKRDSKALTLKETRIAKCSMANKKFKLRVRALMNAEAEELLNHHVGGRFAYWDKDKLKFYQRDVPDLSWTSEEHLQSMFETIADRFNKLIQAQIPEFVDEAFNSNFEVEKIAVDIDYSKLLRTKKEMIVNEGHRSKKVKAGILSLTVEEFKSILDYRYAVGYCSKIPYVPLSHRMIKFINL